MVGTSPYRAARSRIQSVRRHGAPIRPVPSSPPGPRKYPSGVRNCRPPRASVYACQRCASAEAVFANGSELIAPP
jgi:hypothetical protein